jgi:surface carbohydrate biosynthesis protein
MSSVKSLYLPVEGLARELDGKLLLALIARERGWNAVIGYKHAIRDRRATLPPGFFLGHNARLKKPSMFRRMTKLGHRVAVLDEEALVRQTDEIFLMKHDRDAFANVSQVLTWGEDDAAFWRRSSRVDPARVTVTGNPRMDMLRPDLRAFHDPEVGAIRERFGDYLLINTNFPTVNHYVPERETLVLAKATPEDAASKQRTDFLEHKRALFEGLLRAVPKIAAAIAPTRLVVRPHPSERHDPWIEAAKDAPNAEVVSEGSVVPWLAGARALIHNGCTSAVEAAVLGTTVLSYRPVTSETYDNPLPNGVGIECFDEDELVAAVKDVLEKGTPSMTEDRRALLERHVASMTGPLACERVVEAFDRLVAEEGIPTGPGALKRMRANLKIQRRTQWRLLQEKLSAEGRVRLAYIDRKMSQMTPQRMDERIARFQSTLGRFEGRRARPLGKYLFAIE